MDTLSEYKEKIEHYFKVSENAYKDAWDLNESYSMHYGYWDKSVKSFRQSLARTNEIMVAMAGVNSSSYVLDAGCGIGGSSIWLAKNIGCKVTGITNIANQVDKAQKLSEKFGLNTILNFEVRDYCDTGFPSESFDVVWALESVCYAENKDTFIKEAYRLLKPGGVLVLSDGMVNKVEYNQKSKVIRRWLDGWSINYLETPENWEKFAKQCGFRSFELKDVSRYMNRSSRRLFWVSLGAYILTFIQKYIKRKPWSKSQVGNIHACFYQYCGLKMGLWKYAMFVAKK